MQGISLTLPDPERGLAERTAGRCWIACDPEAQQAVTWLGPVTIGGPAGSKTHSDDTD
ncbi:hypothetical protein [Streptomyces sp. SBT349]|uniref:hypothetical protein n=1 Tax=Streptomyces sp. SBT349 TaxID=1580539 RepID=UPI000ADB88AD|nr:hypothetical protein [Streptomyces sp. SBT349]